MATRETIASERAESRESRAERDSQSRLARIGCVRPDIYTPGIDCWLRGVGVVGIKEKICTSAQLMPSSSGAKPLATRRRRRRRSLDKDFQFCFCFCPSFYSELTKSFFPFFFRFLKKILASCRIKSCKVQPTFLIRMASVVISYLELRMASTEAL